MYDVHQREQKAQTMVAVLQDHFDIPLNGLRLLNVGSSTGIIDNYLADYFQCVDGIDIDSNAIGYAKQSFRKNNLRFAVGDAMSLEFSDATFDVVVCSQVYEHVPDATKMIGEIYRVLKPGGVCYFAAGNRLMWNEPHYGLPLLSVMPRALAHIYLRMARGEKYYHEFHLTYWGLRQLVSQFEVYDYTAKMVNHPEKFYVGYMLKSDSLKAWVAKIVAEYFYFLMPGYIWLLSKS